MNAKLVAALSLATLLLGGCARDHGNMDRQEPAQSSNPPVNPYSNGGFSDPGPNYPATGH